jgi:hypothetical protein
MDQRVNGSLVLIGLNAGSVSIQAQPNGGSLAIRLPNTLPQRGQVLSVTDLLGNAVVTGWTAPIPNASSINGIPITGALTHAGQIPISQPDNASAVWGDPLVQGLYAPGANVLTANPGSTPINPVLIGATNPSNLLKSLNVDSSGNLLVAGTTTATIGGTVAVTQSTSPWVVSGTVNVVSSPPLAVAQTAMPGDATATGTITLTAQNVAIATNGAANVILNVTGAWSGTLQPQLQLADSSWVNSTAFPVLPGGPAVGTIAANGQWETLCGGFKGFRLLSTGTWTSGTATINLQASQASTAIAVRQLTAANLNATVSVDSSAPLATVSGVPKIVQKASVSSTGSVSSISLAFPNPVKAGNTIIVSFAAGTGTAGTPVVADSQVNSYTNSGNRSQAGLTCGLSYAFPQASGANTVTLTKTGAADSMAMQIYEVSGLYTAYNFIVDVNAGSQNTSSSIALNGFGAYPNEFHVTAIGLGTSAQTITLTNAVSKLHWQSDSGQVNPASPGTLFSFLSASSIGFAPSFDTFAATLGGSVPWVAQMMGFIPALSATASVVMGGPFSSGSTFATSPNPVVVGGVDFSALLIKTLGFSGGSVQAILTAGTAVIGHVIVDASSAVIGHVIVDTAPSTAVTNAGTFATQSTLSAETTKVIGTVNVASSPPLSTISSVETSTVYSGTTALTPLFSTIVASASGATTVVALVSSKKIRVLAMQLVASAAVNVKWQSSVAGDITGLAYLAANGGYVLPFNPTGWFQTVAGEALVVNLSGAFAVGGSLTYVTV